jgi:hypothetical protein
VTTSALTEKEGWALERAAAGVRSLLTRRGVEAEPDARGGWSYLAWRREGDWEETFTVAIRNPDSAHVTWVDVAWAAANAALARLVTAHALLTTTD